MTVFYKRTINKIQHRSRSGIIKGILDLNMRKANVFLSYISMKSRQNFGNYNKPLQVVMQVKVVMRHRVWSSRI